MALVSSEVEELSRKLEKGYEAHNSYTARIRVSKGMQIGGELKTSESEGTVWIDGERRAANLDYSIGFSPEDIGSHVAIANAEHIAFSAGKSQTLQVVPYENSVQSRYLAARRSFTPDPLKSFFSFSVQGDHFTLVQFSDFLRANSPELTIDVQAVDGTVTLIARSDQNSVELEIVENGEIAFIARQSSFDSSGALIAEQTAEAQFQNGISIIPKHFNHKVFSKDNTGDLRIYSEIHFDNFESSPQFVQDQFTKNWAMEVKPVLLTSSSSENGNDNRSYVIDGEEFPEDVIEQFARMENESGFSLSKKSWIAGFVLMLGVMASLFFFVARRARA